MQAADETVSPFETRDGGEWPTRAQMNRVEELANEHPSVSVGRVKGTDRARVTYRPEGSYSDVVEILETDGTNVAAEVLRPDSAEVKLPLELVKRLLGGEGRLEAGIAHAVAKTPTYTSFGLGNYLAPAVIETIEALLDEAGR